MAQSNPNDPKPAHPRKDQRPDGTASSPGRGPAGSTLPNPNYVGPGDVTNPYKVAGDRNYDPNRATFKTPGDTDYVSGNPNQNPNKVLGDAGYNANVPTLKTPGDTGYVGSNPNYQANPLGSGTYSGPYLSDPKENFPNNPNVPNPRFPTPASSNPRNPFKVPGDAGFNANQPQRKTPGDTGYVG